MKKLKIFTGILVLLTFTITFYIYPSLPDQVINQYNNGEIGYANKIVAFVPASISVAFYILSIVIEFLLPVENKYGINKANCSLVSSFCIILLSIMDLFLLYIYYTSTTPLIAMTLAIAISFIVVGNWFPKIRKNLYTGVKYPWTYASNDNWLKTHRRAGKVFVACSLVSLLSILVVYFTGLDTIFCFVFTLCLATISGIYATIYSVADYLKNK